MKYLLCAACAALAFIGIFSHPAMGQTARLFQNSPVSMRCFQNGKEIFAIGPLQSLSQVGVERTVEFITEDGRPGQIRVVGTVTCIATAVKE